MTLMLYLNQLAPGDHVFWKREKGYDHHAIVEYVDRWNSKFHTIEYDGELKRKNQASIKRKTYNFYEESAIGLYKYFYNRCHDAATVLRRARSRLGERTYNFITNNCEHFSQWCKTGKERCSQLVPHVTKLCQGVPTGVVATGIGRHVALKTSGLASGFRQIIKEGWKQVGKNGLKTACKAVVVGVASAVVEGGFFLYNCYKSNQAYKEGMRTATREVDREHYRKERSIKRKQDGCEFGGGVVGATVGSLLGSVVPFVGTAIGAAIGGFLGSCLGKVFGRWLF